MAGSGIKDSMKKAGYVSEDIYFHELNLELIRKLRQNQQDSSAEERLTAEDEDDIRDEAA